MPAIDRCHLRNQANVANVAQTNRTQSITKLETQSISHITNRINRGNEKSIDTELSVVYTIFQITLKPFVDKRQSVGYDRRASEPNAVTTSRGLINVTDVEINCLAK